MDSQSSENQWPVYHAFNKLARRGIVKPITCHVCHNDVILKAGEDDEPVFECFSCERITKPGMNTYESLKWAVENYG